MAVPSEKPNTVEDCVMYLASEGAYMFEPQPPIAQYDKAIVESLGRQLGNGNEFTEKQSSIGIRLVKKYGTILDHAGFDTKKIIDEELFKWPFRIIDKTKSLYLDGEKIVIKSPFIADVINKIKKRKRHNHVKGDYRPDSKEWSFDYNETNLLFLVGLVQGLGFNIDQKIQEDFDKCVVVQKNALDYYPTMIKQDGVYKYNNEVLDSDVRKAIMQAKLRGCAVYDDAVVDDLKPKQDIDKILTGDAQNWFINSAKYSVLDIIPLIKIVDQCIIMCNSSDNKRLVLWVESLLDGGYANEELSVTFRYKKADGWFEGNKYIKNMRINEFNEDKKIYFINEKVPKSLIKSSIDPQLIICDLSVLPSHYKTQAWLQNKPTVVYYCGSQPSGVDDCANL